MKQASVTFPNWLEKLPARKRETCRRRFLLNIAAAHHNQFGRISELSRALGRHPNTLNVMLARKESLPAGLCVDIEKLVGRHVMPREILNPEIFSIPL